MSRLIKGSRITITNSGALSDIGKGATIINGGPFVYRIIIDGSDWKCNFDTNHFSPSHSPILVSLLEVVK